MSQLPVVVIGAGIVGLSTAFALMKRGHHVVVVDRLAGPAQFCSRGNAGIIAVGHAKPWAGPEAIGSIMRAFVGREPGIRLTHFMNPHLWRWGLSFLTQCTASAHEANAAKLQKLSLYSRQVLIDAAHEIGTEADLRHEGTIYVFRSHDDFEAHSHGLGSDPASRDYRPISREEIIALEPAMQAMAESIAGGMISTVDSAGDCRLFSERLADAMTRRNNVEFNFDTNVTGYRTQRGRVVAVTTDLGEIACEHVVLAGGSLTSNLARSLGIRPLVYPVKGYSGTWKILKPEVIPLRPFIDETELVAVTRLGDNLRITALAEYAGYDRAVTPHGRAILDNYVDRYFNGALDAENVEYWAGLRPTTPSGTPYIGRIKRFENAWINAGHGQLGWTMGMGSGEVLAQRMSGETVTIDAISAKAGWLEGL